MDARWFLAVMLVAGLLWDALLNRLSARQRLRPLPPSVADVYDADRYRAHLEYGAVRRRLAWGARAVDAAVTLAIIFSPFFRAMELAAGENPYLTVLYCVLVFWAISSVTGFAVDWVAIFRIAERFGLNRQTKGRFVREFCVSSALSLLSETAMMLFLAFILEHLAGWRDTGIANPVEAVRITGAVFAAFLALGLVMMGVSLLVLKSRYRLTPLEEGPLYERIREMLEGSRKKVRRIFVYDESSRSTSKNAFVMSILGYRMIGIADNFLDGNGEREVLSVLAHEIGHLKHRRTAMDVASWAPSVIALAVVILLFAYPAPAVAFADWVDGSFGLAATNVYLLWWVLSAALEPWGVLTGWLSSTVSRSHEYEADRNAVAEGYGRELIASFKRLSADELVNVNPHPAIEALTYSHPGMANRIAAIERAMEEGASVDGDGLAAGKSAPAGARPESDAPILEEGEGPWTPVTP